MIYVTIPTPTKNFGSTTICFESDATIDLALLPDGSQVYGFNKYWSFNAEQARQLKALMEEITEA